MVPSLEVIEFLEATANKEVFLSQPTSKWEAASDSVAL